MLLLEREVHLWWAAPDARALPDLLPLLSAEELATANRFRFEEHRVLYAFAHGALRVVLARYAGGDPRGLEFERVGNGRPELRGREVRFNLAHTAGLVLIGVAKSADIGVDAEFVAAERGRDEQLAQRVFTPGELAAWRRDDCFFERWTLKEAYIKARGEGLSLELRSFGFPGLAEGPDIEDVSAWQFVSFAPTPAHRAAAAARAPEVDWTIAPLALTNPADSNKLR
jgi:4'-phosphopantetheinyl transferase